MFRRNYVNFVVEAYLGLGCDGLLVGHVKRGVGVL